MREGLRSALWVLMLLLFALSCADTARAQAASPQPPPPQVQELLRLLEDPATRAWIEQQKRGAAPQSGAVPQGVPDSSSEILTTRVEAIRGHLADLAAAVPRMPQEARQAADLLSRELRSRPALGIVFLVLGFLALGAGTEWLLRQATASAGERLLGRPEGTVSDRLKAIGIRLAFALAYVAIFALGSIGAFLIFEWPPLLKRIVLTYMVAALLMRLILLGIRILLSPRSADRYDPETFRIIPMSDQDARFWYNRLALFVGWFLFGWATVELARILGFSLEGRRIIAYFLGLGLLILALEVVWKWPTHLPVTSGETNRLRRFHAIGPWLSSLYLVLLWGFWVAGLMGLFWLSVFAVVLPKAVTVIQQSVRHLLRSPSDIQVVSSHDLIAVYLDRGIRALMLVGAVFFLAWVWDIDLVELTSRDTLLTRLARGALSSIVILLVADLLWQVLKTQFDRRLSNIQTTAPPGSEEALRQARLRTLLPMFRMATFIVIAVVAVLMALSSLGVEIGPLIAGAGIVGVAVGFGAQTLVRDIISGVFYLLDDAFRVGEYIQSGSYKGTVESLGFRSVKLRHHRGPIYTVPYGQLGAVENMSRDWVIDKMTINVTYDTDLEKAKKIIKQVGKDLASDPEFAPNILEPLKMQGVEQFGDFAIQLRMKIMTRPGEQFVIRRKAYAMIKKAFDENGVRFAFPTVQVAGHDEASPAVAQHALKLIQGTPPE